MRPQSLAGDCGRKHRRGRLDYLQTSPPAVTPHAAFGWGAVGLEQAVMATAATASTAKVILLRNMALPREGDGGGECQDRS